MTEPYSWFSITITKMCEKAGTAAGVGAGGAAWLGASGLAVAATAEGVAVDVTGVDRARRLVIWAWWSSKSWLEATARRPFALVGLAGACPSTSVVRSATT